LPPRLPFRYKLALTAKDTLNVGLIGYGFMGRTHSNAGVDVTPARHFTSGCRASSLPS
jgi:hypothetical protein